MREAILSNNFSNIQMELLKLYSTNISDNELKEIVETKKINESVKECVLEKKYFIKTSKCKIISR